MSALASFVRADIGESSNEALYPGAVKFEDPQIHRD